MEMTSTLNPGQAHPHFVASRWSVNYPNSWTAIKVMCFIGLEHSLVLIASSKTVLIAVVAALMLSLL